MNNPDPASRFLTACSGQIPEVTPVWLMRQAGRILPPYRALRDKHSSIQTLFTTPELATEITLMPVTMLGVDAAILFTDLVPPLEAMGCPFSYSPGPVFEHPVRTRDDVERLRPLNVAGDLPFVPEIIRSVRGELPPAVPLIGYGGSPFTLATWLVEGKGSKDFSMFRRLLYADPELAHLLLAKLTEGIITFLRSQVEAGVQALQIFDTSIGLLSPDAFKQFVHPYLHRIFGALGELGVPRIYFPLAAPHLMPFVGDLGADVLSIDWRIDLESAFQRFSPGMVLQGNLDPSALYAPPERLAEQVRAILRCARGRPHIFNLGHGVLPDMPYDNVLRLIEIVHQFADEEE